MDKNEREQDESRPETQLNDNTVSRVVGVSVNKKK